PAELVVGDETALLGAELLHGREQAAPGFVVELEAELVRLDPDRVEPALLAQHDSALGADEVGRVRLDRRRVVELACDRAALADEEILADDRLPRLELVPGEAAYLVGDLADTAEVEVRAHAVERPKRQGDVAEVRVPRALA